MGKECEIMKKEWEELVKSTVVDDNDYELEFFKPVSYDEFVLIEKKLEIKFSSQLSSLLKETNGIKNKRFNEFMVWNIKEIANQTLDWRQYLKDNEFKQTQDYIFFSDNGCGELFGYQVSNGEIVSEKIWIWYPMHNEYECISSDLKNWIVGWFSGQLYT